jgi:hypothetical protein
MEFFGILRCAQDDGKDIKTKAKAMVDPFDNDIRTEADSLREWQPRKQKQLSLPLGMTTKKAKAVVTPFGIDNQKSKSNCHSLRDWQPKKAKAIVTRFGNDNEKQLSRRLRGLSTARRTVKLPIASIEMTHLCNQVSGRIFSWSE